MKGGGELSQSSSIVKITEGAFDNYQQEIGQLPLSRVSQKATPSRASLEQKTTPSSPPRATPIIPLREAQRPLSRIPLREAPAPPPRASSRIPLREASAPKPLSAPPPRASSRIPLRETPAPKPSSAPPPRASSRIPLREAQRPSSAPLPSRKAPENLKPYYIKNTLIPDKKKILIHPLRFKANTKLTDLSHSIYNKKKGERIDSDGVLITPEHPPAYITYDMLIREVGVFLEEEFNIENEFNKYDEFNKEKKLQEQYNEAEKEEKKALELKLWKIWYNIISGEDKEDSDNNPPYKKKKLKRIRSLEDGNRIDLEEESIFELLEEERKGGRRRKGSKGSKGSKGTKGTKGTKGGDPTAEEKAAAEEAYVAFLLRTRQKYVDKADNDQTKKDKYGYTEQDYENAYFDFADTKAPSKIRSSYDIKLKLQKRLAANKVNVHDIVCEFPQEDFPYPYKDGFNTLFRPNRALRLYGMQLPHQFNRELLLKSAISLFHKKIYNIADLQGCADAINRHNHRMNIGVGCNPYDRECEPLIWERARFLTISQQPETKCTNIMTNHKLTQKEIDDYQLKDKEIGYLDKGTYYDIKIKDMTAGNLSSWIEISAIKDVSQPENSIVLHCLAGAGRTGSVLLYLLMRDTGNSLRSDVEKREAYYTELKDKLAKPHFGLNNIAEVVGVLSSYFVNKKSRGVKFATRELFHLGSRIMYDETEKLLQRKGVDAGKIKTIQAQGIDTDMYQYLIGIISETEISEIDNRQIKSQASCSLLRQRLNRIFFFLARGFKVNTFYTYGRPTKQVLILPEDEFSYPVERVVSDWDSYDRWADARKWIS